MELLTSISDILANYPYVLAGIVVLLAVMLAWLVDQVVFAFVKRFTTKTAGEFDDRLLTDGNLKKRPESIVRAWRIRISVLAIEWIRISNT